MPWFASSFAQSPIRGDHGSPIPLSDALMSAFAMFSLKDPSLLAFDERRSDGNLKTLFGIGQIPSDTQMREILDQVDPEHLRPVFGDVFRQLQRGKALEPFVFYAGAYLLSLDGTGYFSSPTIHCDSCQVKEHKDGTVTYQHQMLGAVIVHPDLKEVIPLAPEPIQKQDGSTKNDCERNAARRLLRKIRREHPHLKLIVIEDGLASNGPHVRDLIDNGMHFILGVKPGDHAFLFEQVEARPPRRALAQARRGRKGTSRRGLLGVGRAAERVEPGFAGGLSGVQRVRRRGKLPQALHLDHRPPHHPPQCLVVRPRRTGAVEDRERDLQYAEEPGVPFRAQLRARATRTCRWCSPC